MHNFCTPILLSHPRYFGQQPESKNPKPFRLPKLFRHHLRARVNLRAKPSQRENSHSEKCTGEKLAKRSTSPHPSAVQLKLSPHPTRGSGTRYKPLPKNWPGLGSQIFGAKPSALGWAYLGFYIFKVRGVKKLTVLQEAQGRETLRRAACIFACEGRRRAAARAKMLKCGLWLYATLFWGARYASGTTRSCVR